MSNPYETPQWKDGTFKDNPVAGGPPMYSPGMVNQIRVVAILMMVQGSLAVLFGLFYVGMGFIFPQFFATMAEADPNFPQDDAAQLKQMSTFMLFIYVGMGLPAIIGGALQIIGGVRAYQFRNRIFAIIAVCSGFLACTMQH